MVISNVDGNIVGIQVGYNRRGVYLYVDGFQDSQYFRMEIPMDMIQFRGKTIDLEKLKFRKIRITAEIEGDI